MKKIVEVMVVFVALGLAMSDWGCRQKEEATPTEVTKPPRDTTGPATPSKEKGAQQAAEPVAQQAQQVPPSGEHTVDVTGNWKLANAFEGGLITHNDLELQQTGEKLSGTNGAEKLEGTVRGNEIKWNEKTEPQRFDLNYSGSLMAPDTMQGSFEFVGRGIKGTWTAARAKEQIGPNKTAETTR
jgi:hypothetical protein